MVDVKDWASLIISCLPSRYQTASDINLKTALPSFCEKPCTWIALSLWILANRALCSSSLLVTFSGFKTLKLRSISTEYKLLDSAPAVNTDKSIFSVNVKVKNFGLMICEAHVYVPFKEIWKGVSSVVSLISILTSPETSFSSLFCPTNSWRKSAKVHSNLIYAILFFTIVSFSFTIVMHTTTSMFHVIFNEVNENLKAHVSSNSIYQHKTDIIIKQVFSET